MCRRQFLVLLIAQLLISIVDAGKLRHHHPGRQAQKYTKQIGFGHHVRRNTGLWPSVFNLATKGMITTNATCGENGREEFCRMSEGGRGRCGVCDGIGGDSAKRHPIENAIDGTNKWWQSPALYYGPQYEYVTVTLDLKQVYQIAYVIIKSANSPRPGTWILERSVDDITYEPWQYFARTDKECLERFGIPATKGKPHYFTDSEVICTSFYSRLTPLENGEIHTSLVHGRPGANETSPELVEFTKARYVRLRLMGLRGTVEPLPRWFTQDVNKDKRLYYTIKDITIGGQCDCNGHANSCRYNVASGHPECECSHNACGPNCNVCCPMYNQRQWGAGSSRDARQCLPCNCHGHATVCHYEESVDKSGLSLDVDGNYQGGGVCDNCTDYTTGINCERCLPGYYRPFGVSLNEPCTKCECDPMGSNGTCIGDGAAAGNCECLLGYAGRKCDSCADGYKDYPNCELCPCDPKGVAQTDRCDDECVCKTNVEGKYCDRCKPGYFGLHDESPFGCISCYCSGVTQICTEIDANIPRIDVLKNWMITDLKVSKTVKPAWDKKGIFSIGSYELLNVESLFWLAQDEYLGNKLEYYDSMFIFKVHWVLKRGDTSGDLTQSPNMIICGQNGMRIAHGYDIFEGSNMTFNVKMNEEHWYYIPDNTNDTTDLKEIYVQNTVNRHDFLRILVNIKHILLRSTFHTDQVEALLENAVWKKDKEQKSRVEKCHCPSGYTGLSCESCSYGYVRIYTNTNTDRQQAFCGKCDCNGHSETCNADTGECFCQHNTIGESCERCLPGFYGNPLRGTTNDCKRCACPLENEENNFSPSCQLDYYDETEADMDKYVCTQCPKGYTGDHCEICDDGYFGNPLEIGNDCKPCNCNGGPCNPLTGQCLSCKGNTEGWKCEKCKSGHYGDPATSNCKPCQCDPLGSTSKDCDLSTGQCVCKERFTGRICDECEIGYGNVTAFCTHCACNSIGSISDICNRHTGLCECRPGVEGFHCDACQNFHYGFSDEGCKACDCDAEGSLFRTCDQTTGQCICRPHFIGRNCARCEDGYWRNGASGCVRCSCDPNGSYGQDCVQETGHCRCKPGVGGQSCNSCLTNYYGSVDVGCRECEPCHREGHVCDSETGKCVCPRLTHGSRCEECAKNAWGYEPGIGCKACDCSTTGSLRLQCDRLTGNCVCRKGYEGEKCDRCSWGHYGYPNCRKCKCKLAGTESSQCSNGACHCAPDGSCNCKRNVQGKHCDTCKPHTFGIDLDHPYGCTECFCFGRSRRCTSSDRTWDQIRSDSVRQDNSGCITSNTCWRLPDKFIGDLTLSYSGYLRVSSNSLDNFLVYLTGNGITIESPVGELDIKMNEHSWKLKYDDLEKLPLTCRDVLTRECFLVIIQNVSNIQIETGTILKGNEFNEVLLDKATELPGDFLANTVEKCECPNEYTSLSCQDPNIGYYRYYPTLQENYNFIDRTIGVARPCQCNGRSNVCHMHTGHCMNCTDHTTGPHCEYCAEGYYRDFAGNCSPCHCPNEIHNFAKNCTPGRKPTQFICNCKPGYIGAKCTQCDDRYWGNPLETGLCQACNCNPYGSEDPICDKHTGLCKCRPEFTGVQCSKCIHPRQIIENGVCTPCDECAQMLFDLIDKLSAQTNRSLELVKDGVGPPWQSYDIFKTQKDELQEKYDKWFGHSRRLIDTANLGKMSDDLTKITHNLHRKNQTLHRDLKNLDKLRKDMGNASKTTMHLQKQIVDVIGILDEFGNSQVNIKDALQTGKRILNEIDKNARRFDTYDEYQSVFNDCDIIYEDVRRIFNGTDSKNDNRPEFDRFRERLADLQKIIDQIRMMIKSLRHKNKHNSHRIRQLNATIIDLNAKKMKIDEDSAIIATKMRATNDLNGKMTNIGKMLKGNELEKLLEDLEDLENRIVDETPEINRLVVKVREHVADLEDKIEIYKNTFNFTQEEWKKINASGAYEEIIKGIRKAQQDADESQEILGKALAIISPQSEDSIPVKATIASALSDRLLKRIINLKNQKNDFKKIHEDLESLKYSILNNGKTNNNHITVLHNLKERLASQAKNTDKLDKTITDSRNISDRMRKIEQEVNNMNLTNQYELLKNYEKLKNLTNKNDIDNLMDNITLTRIQLQNVNINFSYIDEIKRRNEMKFQNNRLNLDSMQDRISELKNKITYAKQLAESVNIAMSIANCRRHYRLSNDVLKSLTVTFKCKSCLLFNLTNSKSESISMEIVNNQIVLNWKDQIRKIESSPKTTTVNIERIGKIVKIRSEQYDNANEAVPILDKDLFRIESSDWLQLGRLSFAKEEDACLSKFMVNDQILGLWNFVRSEGDCPGCEKDTNSTEKVNVFFTGYGYRNATGAKNTKPTMFNGQFYFSTFDENAVIFLAQDPEDYCAFIALTLTDGHLQLTVRHIDGTNITLISNKTYNNGREILVDFGLLYKNTENLQTYSMMVNGENLIEHRILKTSSVFKIKKSQVFIGGVPSTFNKSCLPFDPISFLGFLRSGTAEYEDPVRTTSYGTRLQGGELQFNKAWFSGKGYLEIGSGRKYKIPLEISFILRPVVDDCFVMELRNLLKIYLKENRIVIELKNYTHHSDANLDNDINTIEIIINDGFIDLNINDRNEIINQIPTLPKGHIEIDLGNDRSRKQIGFEGGISNIVINNSTMMFEASTVQSFKDVEIGRDRPLEDLMFVDTNSMKEMQNTEGCSQVTHYQTDPDAIKFGDKAESYLRIENQFWKKDYTLEFEFRTFYPNGLLFLAVGTQSNQHYNLLEIKEGKVRLIIKGKRMKTLQFQEKINDGNWHSVSIRQAGVRKKRKLTIALDGNPRKPVRIPKNNVKAELFVGGVSTNLFLNKDLENKVIQFRGCLRSLQINDSPQFLIKNKKTVFYSNIGQCFPRIEEGAYFGGDSFAVYKSAFRVNRILELSFEFRTVEQNGILLSVSNYGNSPALSVELQNGAVVMAIDMGNGAISNVTNSLDSEFSLCDNRWHNVTALYSSAELTVNVDGIRKSWVQSDVDSLMDEIEAPLYVGGLSDNAPSGTLRIKENFKGCIRKLKIEDKLMDWTDMEELSNVLLSSCPIA